MNYIIPDGQELRVAISGKSGCGNTTVSKMLADALDIRMINFTFRSLATETGLSLAEIIERAKTDDSFDLSVDTRQVELAKEQSCILGSRLAIWMLKDADFKVYLLADDEVRAMRIQDREGGDLTEIRNFTHMRDNEDTARYKRLYDIDNCNYTIADLVIDTVAYDPVQIIGVILEKLRQKALVQLEND